MSAAPETFPSPSSPAETAVLAVLQRAFGSRYTMPAPMPPDPSDAVRWWITQMSEPRHELETPEEFGQRCAFALNGWLRLSKQDRTTVASLAINGTPYHGDEINRYIAICDESEHMREIGLELYRPKAIAKMKHAIRALAARQPRGT